MFRSRPGPIARSGYEWYRRPSPTASRASSGRRHADNCPGGASSHPIDDIANATHSEGWFKTIFGKKSDEVVEHISEYSGTALTSTRTELEHISNEAVRSIRKALTSGHYSNIATLLSDERNNTLLYLPASLQIGEILGNDNLDDRTHKMEGPVSSFLNNIEKHFNSNANT